MARDLRLAADEGFAHGSKVVRGGYMVEVRAVPSNRSYCSTIRHEARLTTCVSS